MINFKSPEDTSESLTGDTINDKLIQEEKRCSSENENDLKDTKDKFNFVTNDVFDVFYKDYISFKGYMDDILNSFIKESSKKEENVKVPSESKYRRKLEK